MIRAVICDDEKAALNIIRHFIEAEMLPIEIAGTAENGRDAWNLIQREKPDLVFMDIHMPYMNGFEIIQKMKDSKVIIITAYDSFEYAQKALRLGAVDIILKPIDFQQLRQAIARAVGWNFTGNEVVDQILAYLYEHYNDKIDLETLARQIFCSESHLARSLKKYTGMTVVSFVHKIRIEKSRHMLKEEGLSVKEAAERAGYQNLNHFYKYFKQYTGMTPAAYMKKNGSRTAIDLAEKGTENGEEKL
ncbi:MAG TPA: response regulator [Candidatus Blautia stercoripullorum]|uniref:Stage 0 sporulation protein A homolog n=1 Tax=Candidatus Blautia stercoripullorum TaxID=2838502 RepID=A0A9D2U4B4_9FIRM|nr:response regulator [Candidatus Blautia stercoripullorum]